MLVLLCFSPQQSSCKLSTARCLFVQTILDHDNVHFATKPVASYEELQDTAAKYTSEEEVTPASLNDSWHGTKSSTLPAAGVSLAPVRPLHIAGSAKPR